jgi:hypothetical protein
VIAALNLTPVGESLARECGRDETLSHLARRG